jgi:transposase
MEAPAPERPTYEELAAENTQLRQQVATLTAQLAAMAAKLEAALAEIERLKRAGRGQATPFSKGERKADPQRPGRKPDAGPFRFRAAPAPEAVVGAPVVVPVGTAACPECGGALQPEASETVWVTDLPPLPRAETRAYELGRCRCAACGRVVRGTHPDVASEQRGATAHRLGRRLLAAAHLLHYGIGLPVRRVPAVLRLLCGVEVTQGALTQDAVRRAAGRVGAAYRELRQQLAQAPAVNTDDTGWSVGGEPAWLMAFDTPHTVVYQIRRRHRNEEVREVIPANYAGVLGTDRGPSYDAQALQDVRQQKCLAHVLRNLSEVLAGKQGRARWFGRQLGELLRSAVAVWHRWQAGEWRAVPERYAAVRAVLVRRVTWHLRDRKVRDPDNQRLLDELGWHQDRGNLLRFLYEREVEPTNNRAERALRGAVIARKVSQCNKNTAGAAAFGAFTSVVKTVLRRRPDTALETLVQVFVTGIIPEPTPTR